EVEGRNFLYGDHHRIIHKAAFGRIVGYPYGVGEDAGRRSIYFQGRLIACRHAIDSPLIPIRSRGRAGNGDVQRAGVVLADGKIFGQVLRRTGIYHQRGAIYRTSGHAVTYSDLIGAWLVYSNGVLRWQVSSTLGIELYP